MLLDLILIIMINIICNYIDLIELIEEPTEVQILFEFEFEGFIIIIILDLLACHRPLVLQKHTKDRLPLDEAGDFAEEVQALAVWLRRVREGFEEGI